MTKVKNERNTENLVRKALAKNGYDSDNTTLLVEEQKTSIATAAKLLNVSSKSGKNNRGAPEFIISNSENPEFLIIIECKSNNKDHCSSKLSDILLGNQLNEDGVAYSKRVQRFAADGGLHYGQALSKNYNVIVIAVSGENSASLSISTYLYIKNNSKPQVLRTKHGTEVDKILPWKDYIEYANFDPSIQRMRHDELMAFSRELHDFMRDHAKLTESEKPLVVSGTLIALRDLAFSSSYDKHSPVDLQKKWLSVIKDEIDKASIPNAKKTMMAQPYSSIAVHPELGKPTKYYPQGVLNELIRRLKEKVYPFISTYHDFDIVGQFYGEFLKYTGGDKKALGIVLTPRHITELFSLLANVTKKSKCIDICAGTGGFLISAMVQMLKSAKSKADIDYIKAEGLIGVEQQPNMYALAASNMILRGDGKANLYQGSCFDSAIQKEIKARKANIGLLNPPFSQGDADFHEMIFIKQMLDCLVEGGTGIAIVPMSCAISPHQARVNILKSHTLEAVMSMPDDLFYPVGTVTCIMVFTAHRPHEESNKKTWFGYWKKDGFIKTKHRGRIDLNNTWPNIRDRWVEMYRNREVHAGESVLQKVSAKDEWCAEAYMETDYTRVYSAQMSQAVKDYVAFKLQSPSKVTVSDLEPEKSKWKPFKLSQLFDIKKGKRLTKANQTEGQTPYIGAIESNNGVSDYIGQKPIHKGGTISVSYNGSVAEAFYQPVAYWATDDVNVLYPKDFSLTPTIALFICTIIRLEKYRFNYGRKWHLERMNESIIRLPVTLSGNPDWKYIESYMSQLPYSAQI